MAYEAFAAVHFEAEGEHFLATHFALKSPVVGFHNLDTT